MTGLVARRFDHVDRELEGNLLVGPGPIKEGDCRIDRLEVQKVEGVPQPPEEGGDLFLSIWVRPLVWAARWTLCFPVRTTLFGISRILKTPASRNWRAFLPPPERFLDVRGRVPPPNDIVRVDSILVLVESLASAELRVLLGLSDLVLGPDNRLNGGRNFLDRFGDVLLQEELGWGQSLPTARTSC